MAENNPLVTVHITSYNNYLLLKNLIDSLVLCNEYKNIELIIVDNGSTDEKLLNFYETLKKELPFPFELIRNEKNDYPCCVWRAKNQARKIARGEYFIDLPNDQQFIRKGSWVRECLEVFEKENKAACVVFCAYPSYRWKKINNRIYPESEANGVPYFNSYYKGYVDYHIMPRSVYEKVGPFLDQGFDDRRIPEPDYMERCTKMGFKRIFLKYPAAVIIPEEMKKNSENNGLIIPLWDFEEIKNKFKKLNRPVSNQELCRIKENPFKKIKRELLYIKNLCFQKIK